MKDGDKTKEQLINELEEMRRRVADLEAVDTERQRAEEARQESEERFRELVENANDIIYTHDPKGNFTSTNPAATRIYGYTNEEILQLNIAQIVDPEYLPLARQKIREKLEGTLRTEPYELLTYSKEGKPIWVEVSTRLLERAGQLVGVLGIARDITERKRAKEALRESESRLSSMLSSMVDLVFAFDNEGRFIFHHSPYTGDLYLPPDEFMGKKHSEVMPPHLNEPFVEAFEKNKKGEVAEFECWLEIGGRVRWFSANLSPVFLEGGFAGSVAVAREITDRKRSGEEIRRRNRELAALNTIATTMMQSALDLDEVLQRIADGVVEGLGCNTAVILLLDEKEGAFKGSTVSTKGKVVERINAIIGFPLDQIKFPARSDFNEAVSNALNGQITIKRDLYELVSPALSKLVCSALQGLLGSKTFLSLPLLARGKVVGGIFASTTREELSEEDIETIMTFANQAAIAIENARLFEAERRRSVELEALRQASLHLISSLELQTILEAILDHAFKLVSAYDVHLFLYDGERLAFGAALWGDGRQREPYAEPRTQGLTYAVAHGGEPIVVPDVNSHPLFRDYQWGGSIVGLPLRIGERVVGVMTIAFEKPHAFDESELRVLGLLADQAAIAIENARLYEETKQRALEQETLREAALALTTALDRNRVIERILAQLQRVVPYDSASIQLLQGDMLVLIAGRGFPNLEELLGTSFPVNSDNPNREVMRTLSPSILEDAPVLYEAFTQEPFAAMGIRSWLGVPMLIGDRPVGMITLDKREAGFYTQEHARLAEAFAAQATVAIENARLFEETQQRALEQETLREAALALTTALDRNRVIERILAQLQQVVPYDSASVQLLKENRMQLVGGRGFPNLPDLLGISFPADGDNPNSEVIRTRAPFIVEDAPAVYEGFRKGPHMQTVIRSWLGVPMLIGERLVGMIALDKSKPRFYTQEHARLAEAFAAQAATAIENARLYEETQRQSERLAQTLTVSELLHRGLELEQLLEQIAQGAVELGFRRAVINVCQPGDELVRVRAMAGVEGPDREALMTATYRWPDFQALMQERFKVSRSYLIRHGEVDWEKNFHGVVVTPSREERGLGYWHPEDMLLVPLWGSRGEPVGLLSVDEPVDGLLPDLNTIQTLEAFANQVTIAIENARLFEEIEERRMYLEGVLGAAPDAIVTLNARHRIVEWNSGAERLFGYSREEVVGQNLDDLITNPDVFEEAVGFTQTAMDGMEVPPTETVRYRKDGSPVDVIVAGSPILVGDKLIGTVAVYTDITARKRMEEALRAMALVDDLTGLYNRRGFFTMSQQQLKMADRTKIRMILLFADFDNLKHINDTLGHPEGDRALIEVANVFRETFRESDIIARIGGDEFVVLAIETDSISPEILATRLQENLEARNARGDRRYKLSLSMGTARYDPQRPCSIDELLTRADRAMYEKKQRNHQ